LHPVEWTRFLRVLALEDVALFEIHLRADEQRQQGYPWKFYGLTDEGREFLEEHNLLAAEETLQQIYDTISDKPEKMVKYENALRPNEA